jgi:SAM-dependent methyltransferase
MRTPLNSSRVHLDRFLRRAAASVPADSIVLDAGAGNAFYRDHFGHTQYETADFMRVDKPYAPDITYVCDLASIPVENDRFDLVVLTQVLEHLPEPVAVLREMRRVLRPGRCIWASCPLFYEEHEQPYDFYRYTQFALRRMFADAGFEDPEIEWLEGYLGTVGYELDVASRALPRTLLVGKAALNGAAELCARRDVRHKRTDRGHPKNYTIVAR